MVDIPRVTRWFTTVYMDEYVGWSLVSQIWSTSMVKSHGNKQQMHKIMEGKAKMVGIDWIDATQGFSNAVPGWFRVPRWLQHPSKPSKCLACKRMSCKICSKFRPRDYEIHCKTCSKQDLLDLRMRMCVTYSMRCRYLIKVTYVTCPLFTTYRELDSSQSESETQSCWFRRCSSSTKHGYMIYTNMDIWMKYYGSFMIQESP